MTRLAHLFMINIVNDCKDSVTLKSVMNCPVSLPGEDGGETALTDTTETLFRPSAPL